MGRAGIEPATLGLKAPVGGFGASRRGGESPANRRFSYVTSVRRFRSISEALVITLLTPFRPTPSLVATMNPCRFIVRCVGRQRSPAGHGRVRSGPSEVSVRWGCPRQTRALRGVERRRRASSTNMAKWTARVARGSTTPLRSALILSSNAITVRSNCAASGVS
jgi:hypothetical protein